MLRLLSNPRPALGSIALLLLLVASPARALASEGDKEDAKRKAYSGVAAYQAGDCQKALADLEPAYAVIQAPSVGLWSARALEKCGKWVEAAARYRDVLQLAAGKGDSKVQEQARADAARELQALSARLPRVDVHLENADVDSVNVTFDGESMSGTELRDGRAANPGTHELVGLKGDERVVVSVVARESEHQIAALKFAPPPVALAKNPPPQAASAEQRGAASDGHTSASPMRTVGLVAMGVGGAGLVFGGVSALIAIGSKPKGCAAGVCPSSDQSGVDSYNSWRTVSTFSFWTGAAVAAAGVAVFFTAPTNRTAVAVRVTPSSAELDGVF